MRAFAIAAALLAFSVLAADAAGARAGKRQLWGSIAYSTKTGSYGFAVDRTTRRDDETEAFRLCGANCDLLRSDPGCLRCMRLGSLVQRNKRAISSLQRGKPWHGVAGD